MRDVWVEDPCSKLYARRPDPKRKTPEEAEQDQAAIDAWMSNPENRKRVETLKALSYADAAALVAKERFAWRNRLVKANIERAKKNVRKDAPKVGATPNERKEATIQKRLCEFLRDGKPRTPKTIFKAVQSSLVAQRLLVQAEAAGYVKKTIHLSPRSGNTKITEWSMTEKGKAEWK